MNTNNIPPNNPEAENALLSLILSGFDSARDTVERCIAASVTYDSFFDPKHQIVFEAILGAYNKNYVPDTLTVWEEIQIANKQEAVGGFSFLTQMPRWDVTNSNLDYCIQILKDREIRRRAVKVCREVMEKAQNINDLDELLATVNKGFINISESRESGKTLKADRAIAENVAELEAWTSGDQAAKGLETGFYDLDAKINGLEKGRMIVLAARPSIGKTSLAVNIIENLIKRKNPVPVLFFTMEMRTVEILKRMISGISQVQSGRIVDKLVSSEEKLRIQQTIRMLAELPLFINESANNVYELKEAARLANNKEKLGLIVVDYLQLINAVDRKVLREQQIAEISKSLKIMAKELNCPVLVLAQLNRESEKEKRRPIMSDLRDSGSIEQDADIVMFLHREGHDETNKRDLVISKNRSGSIGCIKLAFQPELTKFSSMAFGEDESAG